MKTYVFKNAGVIDPRSITTFGVSSKEGSNPIGFFGTGLKYAIAVLLRLKCDITIHSGGQTYTFTKKPTKIRVNEFDLVCMNGQELGFTTELGKQWEAWQAFRELACNCIDESGTYHAEDVHPTWIATNPDHTTILVTGSAFDQAWTERDSVILSGKPLYEDSRVAVHSGKSEWAYYRGVRVAKLNAPSKFTYSLLDKMELTEDRTFKYSWMAPDAISRCVRFCDDEKIVKTVVLSKELDTFEGSFTYSGGVSECFTRVVTEALKTFDPRLNVSAGTLIKKGNRGQFISDDTKFLDGTDRQRLKIAVAFCEKLGFQITKYPVIISDSMGDSCLGMAENETIYISTRTFKMGTKMLAGTLIEEYLHLKHGLMDETRSMQNHLMDLIVSMGERITKKVL